MKFTKRLFAVTLIMALALGLAMPAAAAVNWDEFRITGQPQGKTVTYGESFTLGVEVAVPEEVEAVEYHWYREAEAIEGAAAPELRLGPGDREYPSYARDNTGWNGKYYVKVTAYETDGDGSVVSSELRSNDVTVIVRTFAVWRPTNRFAVKYGESFTLRAAAEVAPGVELKYKWRKGYSSNSPVIQNATGPELRIGPNDPNYPLTRKFGPLEQSSYYFCDITAQVKDENGKVVNSKTVSSGSNHEVTVRNDTFLGLLFTIIVEPFLYGGSLAVVTSAMTMGLLIPFAPITFVFGLLFGFGIGFVKVFTVLFGR